MNALFGAAVSLELFCRSRGWRCCIIGGLAVQRWGDPRQTRDVDITILTALGREEHFIDPLLEEYRGRIPNARAFALVREELAALLLLKEDPEPGSRLERLFTKHSG